MDSNHLFPETLPPARPGKLFGKIMFFIFFIIAVIAACIAAMYLSMEENKNSGGTVYGEGLSRGIGKLFLTVAGIFFFIALAIYISIALKIKRWWIFG